MLVVYFYHPPSPFLAFHPFLSHLPTKHVYMPQHVRVIDYNQRTALKHFYSQMGHLNSQAPFHVRYCFNRSLLAFLTGNRTQSVNSTGFIHGIITAVQASKLKNASCYRSYKNLQNAPGSVSQFTLQYIQTHQFITTAATHTDQNSFNV